MNKFPKHSNIKKSRVNHKQLLLLKMMEETDGYAFLLLDKSGTIESWNKGAEKIKGYKAEEIIGKNFSIFYSEKDRQSGLPEAVLSLAALKGTTYNENWRIRKDGTSFWGSLTITALRDENNDIIGYAKVTRDLTEKKLADELIKEHSHQLEIKNKELEQFAYIASHDLQEPLLTVTNFLELLKAECSEKMDDSASLYFGFITQAAERMKNLIKGLLDYSRIGIERTLAPMDCNALINDLKEELAASIATSGAIISYHDLPVMLSSPHEMRQLFQNLIANAIKFRKPDVAPLITITATKGEGFWRFAIADNGIGIADRFKDKIFMIFKRLHNRELYDGNGIGLAHCRKIVEMQGGEIYVMSELGKGSTFYFTIPLNKQHEKT